MNVFQEGANISCPSKRTIHFFVNIVRVHGRDSEALQGREVLESSAKIIPHERVSVVTLTADQFQILESCVYP